MLAFRVLEALEVGVEPDRPTVRTLPFKAPCEGFVSRAAYEAANDLLYVVRILYRPEGRGYSPAEFHVLHLPTGREVYHESFDSAPLGLAVSGPFVHAVAPQARYGLRPVSYVWRGGKTVAAIDRATGWDFVPESGDGTSRRLWAQRWDGGISTFKAGDPIPETAVPEPHEGRLVGVDPGIDRAVFLYDVHETDRSDDPGALLGRILGVSPLGELVGQATPPSYAVKPAYLPGLQAVRRLGESFRAWASDRVGHYDERLDELVYPSATRVPGCGPDADLLMATDDGGVTWRAPAAALACDRYASVLAQGEAANGAAVVFAVTTGGLIRSADGGRTWASAGHGIDTFGVDGVIVSPGFAEDGLVFARGVRMFELDENAVKEGWDTAWRSVDGGQTWRGIGPLRRMALSPDFVKNGRAYALGYYGGGVYRSTDHGATWRKVGQLPAEQGLDLRVAHDSASDAEVLLAYGGSENQPLCCYIFDNENYAMRQWLISRDGGKAWSRIASPRTNDPAASWAFEDTRDNTLGDYREDRLMGPFRAADGRTVLLALVARIDMTAARDAPVRRELYASEDLGGSWELVAAKVGDMGAPDILGSAILWTDAEGAILRVGENGLVAVDLETLLDRARAEAPLGTSTPTPTRTAQPTLTPRAGAGRAGARPTSARRG